MADSESFERKDLKSGISLNFQAVMRLLASTEKFPINFDDAWQWIGYSRKDVAKKKLLNNFIRGTDFQVIDSDSEVFHQTVVNSAQQGFQPNLGGRPSEVIMLTIDCFKSFAMMAGTVRGREVRHYFLNCETELKRRLEEERIVQVDLEQEYKAWQQRYDVRVYLKDFLRKELMDVVVDYARKHNISPIKLASTVHDTMNERIQGVKSQEVKRANNLSGHCLIRDHFEVRPLIDYATINRIAKNAIVDRGVHPVQAVHEACDHCLGLSYEAKPVEIVESVHVQGRRIKKARKQKQLAQGQQLTIWDYQDKAC